MARSTENVLSPTSGRFVLLLLASCGPLLLPAFLLSTPVPPPRQTSSCFLSHAPTGTAPVSATPCAAAASCSAKSCYHADSNRGNGHGHTAPSTTTRGWPAAMRTAPLTMSGLSAGAHPPPHRRAYGPTAATTTRISSSSSRINLLVLGARGGGRSGGDSSRRRTDRPDEYSSDRKKKGKGRGGRGGRSGGRGGSSSGSVDIAASGAPSPFEDSGEFWGGESRLSTLDDRAPAEFSRKIDCSELSRKPKYFSVEATEKECAALAQRFSCEKITGLKADLRVVRGAGSGARKIKVKGRVLASVAQNCAATLEPFEKSVEREFNTVIQEVSLDSVESTLWALEKDTETDDEIMEGDPLDLGEVTAQYLALCIDPFAKHPDFVSVFGAGGGGGDGVGKGGQNPGRFGMPADGEDEVLDVETMRAFFDADD